MALRDVIQLVNFEIKTDKLVNITSSGNNGDKSDQQGTIRKVSIDFNIKKAFALLGLYIGVVNAQAPAIFLNIVQTFVGG